MVCERWSVTVYERLCVTKWCERLCVKDGESSAISATPATQSYDRCRQVSRLPRNVTIDVAKCHACHAKLRSMSPSATPVTQSEDPNAPPEPAQYDKCHACHAKLRSMSPSATPATQSEGGCREVPRLPCKRRRRPRRQLRPKRAARASPVR